MLMDRAPDVIECQLRDDRRIALDIIQTQAEVLDGQQHARDSVVRLERERYDTCAVSLRVRELRRRHTALTDTAQFLKHPFERAFDVVGCDARAARPDARAPGRL